MGATIKVLKLASSSSNLFFNVILLLQLMNMCVQTVTFFVYTTNFPFLCCCFSKQLRWWFLWDHIWWIILFEQQILTNFIFSVCLSVNIKSLVSGGVSYNASHVSTVLMLLAECDSSSSTIRIKLIFYLRLETRFEICRRRSCTWINILKTISWFYVQVRLVNSHLISYKLFVFCIIKL